MRRTQLELLRLDEGLPEPARSYEDDACLDLFAREDVVLSRASGPVTVASGVAVAIPAGHVGLVCSRSGLASQMGIAVLNAPGIIDPGYRGEVQVVLFSVQPSEQRLPRGTRIAQLLILPAPALAVTLATELPTSIRDTRGLGSTGL